MKWEEVRKLYPSEWVLFEAINAYSVGDKRILEKIVVINSYGNDGNEALRQYVHLHKKYPERELYVAHTDRLHLDIKERKWLGVRVAQ